ncbi:MAG: hypothetical protein ACRCUY_13555 [Thermoguttaceae bacterium]
MQRLRNTRQLTLAARLTTADLRRRLAKTHLRRSCRTNPLNKPAD